MSAMPPGAPGPVGGPVPPPRPPMGAPPGMGMPSMPPQGAPPPPPQPPPPGPGGLGPAAPISSLFADLSASMGTGWQCVDIAVRALRLALRSVDFQKTPAVVAVVQSQASTLGELLSHYVSGSSGGSSTPATTSSGTQDSGDGAPPSSDADAQPPADTSQGDDGDQ